MYVENWMTRRVHVVKPLDTIDHARELMVRHRVNQLPVLVDGRLVGIVTDRDLRDAFPSVFESPQHHPQGRATTAAPEAIKVESVMTGNVLTSRPNDSLVHAARLMRKERIGALPVVDGAHVVGIITRSDVLAAFVALGETF